MLIKFEYRFVGIRSEHSASRQADRKASKASERIFVMASEQTTKRQANVS